MRKLIIVILLLMASTCYAQTKYTSIVSCIVKDATLEEMAKIEEILIEVTGDNEPYFQYVTPSDSLSEQQQGYPEPDNEKKDIWWAIKVVKAGVLHINLDPDLEQFLIDWCEDTVEVDDELVYSWGWQ